jgi:hypothetical protein
MNGFKLRGIVVNLCLVFSTSLVFADDNHVFNFINKIADGTQQMAKGIIHETGRVLQSNGQRRTAKAIPVQEPKKPIIAKKKSSSHQTLAKQKIEKPKTTLAQQTNQTSPTTANPSPVPQNNQTTDPNAIQNQPINDPNTIQNQQTNDPNAMQNQQGNVTPPGPSMSGNTDSSDANNMGSGGNANIPEVAEPGQSGTITAPDTNQLPEPPQTNDTTTGITGGESY